MSARGVDTAEGANPAAPNAAPSLPQPALLIEQLAVCYGQHLAVAPASLTLLPGQLIALVGPNGAGKSSLLKAMAGLIPKSGRVCWKGRPLEPLPARERARLLAYLPQSPAAHWPMSARDLVALGRLPHRGPGVQYDAADVDAVRWAMQQTAIETLGERRVDELSGGERTRVLLARALAVRAPVLLADEPVASLDPYHQLQIMAVLAEYAQQGGVVVAVLHDLVLAARFCSRILLMDQGLIVDDGTPEHVLKRSALERHYHVEPFIARHEDEPVIVPWRTVE